MNRPSGYPLSPENTASFRDPVCGMEVASSSKHTHAHQGINYRFCSESCLKNFTASPDRYLSHAAQEASSLTPGSCCSHSAPTKPVAPKSVPRPSSLDDQDLEKITSTSYLPLLVIVALIALAAVVTAQGEEAFVDRFLLSFMTGFFLVFSGFKLLDLKGFVEGYATYDLLAQRWRGYGYLYPFLELGFGLSMLAGYHPDWLLWTEFAVMAFSGLGVALKLSKREPFTCACLGTFLKVPLTYVTILEDFGMATLALALLFR
jgi:YHS domain-containing protein